MRGHRTGTRQRLRGSRRHLLVYGDAHGGGQSGLNAPGPERAAAARELEDVSGGAGGVARGRDHWHEGRGVPGLGVIEHVSPERCIWCREERKVLRRRIRSTAVRQYDGVVSQPVQRVWSQARHRPGGTACRESSRRRPGGTGRRHGERKGDEPLLGRCHGQGARHVPGSGARWRDFLGYVGYGGGRAVSLRDDHRDVATAVEAVQHSAQQCVQRHRLNTRRRVFLDPGTDAQFRSCPIE